MKPGSRSTEFWYLLAAGVLSGIAGTGVLGSGALQIVGIAGSVLAALGYGASRTIVKSRVGDVLEPKPIGGAK